ncbi:MAG: rhodanese-like domain-containing protein [Alphaproteobacteria bacterium]
MFSFLCIVIGLLSVGIPPVYAQNQGTSDTVKPLTYQEYHDFASGFNHQKYTIDMVEFQELSSQKGTVILDLRPISSYDLGHVKGALHLGADITEEKIHSLVPDQDKTLILYCDNSLFPTRMMSLTDVALPQLHQLGYTHTYKLGAAWVDGDTMLSIEEVKAALGFWYPDNK